jgi:hypothetical protein
MRFHNTTHLDSARLHRWLLDVAEGWPHDGLSVSIRYSRGAEFSGCFRAGPPRIAVNLGRANRYPYQIKTQIATARTEPWGWWRPLYTLQVADAFELACFVFLHEFYHWLVFRAGRNGRQKEAMCDRFAVEGMVKRFSCAVRDDRGRRVSADSWTGQNLSRFVRAARSGCAAPS